MIDTQESLTLREQFCRVLAENIQMSLEDEETMLTCYRGFHVQVSFSDAQPMVSIRFLKEIPQRKIKKSPRKLNALNLNTEFGCHATDPDGGYYLFQAGCWLPPSPSAELLFDLLNRCADSANYGCRRIMR